LEAGCPAVYFARTPKTDTIERGMRNKTVKVTAAKIGGLEF